MDQVEGLIRAGQDAARLHPAYFRLYHQITSFGPQEHAREMAEKIEERSAVLYRKMIESAKESSIIKTDLDPAFFAYFFDNLMMMLHFSYACVYYQERFQIYCGEEILEQEEKARQQLMGFIEAALMYQMKEETNGVHSGI